MTEVIMSSSLFLVEESSDKYRLKRTLQAINAGYIDGESGLVIGQCKSLIESLCKSILDESKTQYETDISVGKLAKKAATTLSIGEDHGQDQKTREAFIKLLNSFTLSLENASSSIGALRNDYCPLAHGKSLDHKPLHMLYARFVALQTDAVVSFLLHLIEHRLSMEVPVIFSENEDFNEYLTEEFPGVEIYGDLYQAPDILFQMNPVKYRIALREYKEGATND